MDKEKDALINLGSMRNVSDWHEKYPYYKTDIKRKQN